MNKKNFGIAAAGFALGILVQVGSTLYYGNKNGLVLYREDKLGFKEIDGIVVAYKGKDIQKDVVDRYVKDDVEINY